MALDIGSEWARRERKGEEYTWSELGTGATMNAIIGEGGAHIGRRVTNSVRSALGFDLRFDSDAGDNAAIIDQLRAALPAENWVTDVSSRQLVGLSNDSVRKLLKSRGLSKGRAREIVESFGGNPVYARQGLAGDVLMVTESRVGSASGVFTSRVSGGATPSTRIRNLALPPSNTGNVESLVQLTRPQLLFEGVAGPQPRSGPNRIGGYWQVATAGGKYAGAVRQYP
jgi:hypothetical protein